MNTISKPYENCYVHARLLVVSAITDEENRHFSQIQNSYLWLVDHSYDCATKIYDVVSC